MPVISCVSVLSVLGYLQAMSRQRMEHLPRHPAIASGSLADRQRASILEICSSGTEPST